MDANADDLLARAHAAGFPVARTAQEVVCDPTLARMLPRDEFPRVVPIALAGGVLSVVMDDVPSPAAFRELEKVAGMLVVITVAPPHVVDELKSLGRATGDQVPSAIGPAMAEAVAARASDLHLGVGSPPIVRVNGTLIPLPNWAPLSSADLEDAATWVAGSLDGFTGDLDRAVTYQGRRWRVSVYRQQAALAMAMRLIPSTPPSGDALGLPASVLALADNVSGLILFCGPTGSGKSTSMAALVDRINRSRPCHILTIEDPIEYLHPNRQAIVHQREIGADTKDFATGLRSALRQDPDVILVGELRDLETMETALAAAETGHLVLATLHTSSAPSAITRLVSSFPAEQQDQVRLQVAGSLQGVVFQHLLKSPTKGRVLATEILTCTPGVRNIIREDRIAELNSVLDTSGTASGMSSFDKTLAQLVSNGSITMATALAYVRDRAVFDQHLAKFGQSTNPDDPFGDLPTFGSPGGGPA